MRPDEDWSAFGATVLFSLGFERVTSAYWLDQQHLLSAPVMQGTGIILLIASLLVLTHYALYRRRC